MLSNKQAVIAGNSLISPKLLILVILLSLLTACASTSSTKPTKTLTRDLQNGVKEYRVKSGDTLYSIGFRAGYDYQRLAQWNHIKSPYTIKVGQVLKLYQPAKKTWVKRNKQSHKKNANKSAHKTRTRSQKKLILSKANGKVLKLYWQWPVNGKLLKSFYKTGKKGIDILGKYGQSVKATEGGKVVYSGDGLIGYGNLIIIKHNDVYLSAYANNSRLLVKEGQYVKKGQIIGEIGRAKDQTTTLHFEIRKYGKPVNPVNLLPK